MSGFRALTIHHDRAAISTGRSLDRRTIVADTRKALILREAGYPPVQYIPREDVDMTLLERSAHTTTAHTKVMRLLQHCVRRRAHPQRRWTYETAYDRGGGHQDHLAFYPGRVDAIEERL